MMQWETGISEKKTETDAWNNPTFRVMPALGVMFTFLAGMGDWKVLNDSFGALPKAASLGVIALALLSFWVKPETARVKRACSFIPLFFMLLAVYLLTSLSIWIKDLEVFGSIGRSMEKLGFQAVSIFFAVSMVYLFGKGAIDLFFISMVMSNTAIILLEVPKYGIVESIMSVYEGIVSFGEAEGFMRALELHDMTFLFGQFFIYYLFFAGREDPENRDKYRFYAAVCLFFLLLGFKRLVFPAILFALIVAFALYSAKHIRRHLFILGCAAVGLSFLYIYLINSGLLTSLLLSVGVDMKGRDDFWKLAGNYYEFSIFWRGLGFEAVQTLVSSWVEQGLINHAYPLHNDFLKVYLELGTIGLALWSGIQYVFYPQYWAKKHFSTCAVLYFALISYMSVTYLTDNTAFYYWSSIGLRLLPMAYSFSKPMDEEAPWKPSSVSELASSIKQLEEADIIDHKELGE